jgi:DNA-binding transcriptional regulator YiaG
MGWVAREGFEWAIETLDGWMAELKRRASALGSAELLSYLDTREGMLRDWQAQVSPGLAAAGKLLNILAAAKGGRAAPDPPSPELGED